MGFRLLVLVVLLLVASPAEAEVRAIAFPLQGTDYTYRNDFGEPRDGGARTHEGIDIIAKKMTPIVAVADGRISFIAIPQASWGYSITLTDQDGYQYRYLHMNNDTPGTDDGAGGEANAYAPSLQRGSTVTKGQLIGWVGDSGNAENTVSHLHFEMYAPGRVLMNPFDSLFAASGGVGVNPNTAPIMLQGDVGSLQAEAIFVATRQLQEGMIDMEVKPLHEDLHTLGFYSGPINETYTSLTREAVRQFQVSEQLPATGIADALTRKTLAKVAIPTNNLSTSLELGASGAAVSALQQKLKDLGFFTGEVTGYFGPITKAAVIAFQTARGIDPLGVVGPKTKAALAAGAPPPAGGGAVTAYLELGSRGDQVTLLQQLLKNKGFFHVDVTGIFGPITKAAVIEFQKAKGIDPLGVVGPATRAALNAQ